MVQKQPVRGRCTGKGKTVRRGGTLAPRAAVFLRGGWYATGRGSKEGEGGNLCPLLIVSEHSERRMMGKQAVIDAYEGRYTQVVPWVPYVGVHGAYLIGEPADKVLQDSDLLAKAVLNAAERYT